MIFWLVLKLDLSYRVINILKDFGFFWISILRIFLKIIFLHGEIF
jgi:hypothetical protein